MNKGFNNREFWALLDTKNKTVQQLAKEISTTLATVFKYLKKFNLPYVHVPRPQKFKKGRIDPSKGKRLKQFCPKGHDTFVTGRNANSQCNVCKDEYYIKKGPRPLKQFCINGHDTFICGRNKNGSCKNCVKERYDPEYKRKYKLKNKEKIEAQNREYRTRNKNKIRDSELKRRFGISLDTYNKMFEKQKGKCAICKKSQSELKLSLGVDHNHKTSKVRGLLCMDCNVLLGNAKENLLVLRSAIDYLQLYGGEAK